jgi:hypothetical protein
MKHLKYLAATVIAASLLVTAPFARAVTIDFGSTDIGNFLPTDTYTEDNFQFTVVSGGQWGIVDFNGNPPSGLVVGISGPVGSGDTISVMQIGGGLFTFTALDFASRTGAQTDGVDLIGLVSGVQTQIFPNLTSNTTTFLTLNPLFLTPIDELRIVGASQGSTALILDNFVFNPVSAGVPEAGSSLLLMALALTALLVTRYRLAGAIKR